jgi:hypothetical protein
MSQVNINEIEALINQYDSLANDLFEYTENYWDAMHYDIQGYYGALNEDPKYIDINQLKRQIDATKNLVEAHKSLNYIYG